MLARLWWFWRLIATATAFSTFGLGGLVMSYLYFPLMCLMTRHPEKRKVRAQYAIYTMFRWFVRLMAFTGVGKFHFKNFDRLAQDRGCIFIANHPTLIDYVTIVSRLPRCDNIVKEALWHNPFCKRVVSTAGYIPNIDAQETFDCIQSTSAQGNNLLMFPEGTRTVPNQPIELKRGAAQLVLRTEAKIRLIHIDCTPTTLSKQEKWYNIPKTRPHFRVVVGEKIDSAAFLDAAEGLPSLAARRLTRHLQTQLSQGIPTDVSDATRD
jgi:1-acyl-sn-glycerol-3-phosphate acyltransferase